MNDEVAYTGKCITFEINETEMSHAHKLVDEHTVTDSD